MFQIIKKEDGERDPRRRRLDDEESGTPNVPAAGHAMYFPEIC